MKFECVYNVCPYWCLCLFCINTSHWIAIHVHAFSTFHTSYTRDVIAHNWLITYKVDDHVVNNFSQPMDMSPSRGQGQAFNTQTPIVPGAQVRTPGTMVRPVRAGTPRQPSPQTGPALFSQPRVQVIHTQAGLRAAIPSMVRQPMVINTSSLMPPAQGSQKLASGTNTNLARYVGFLWMNWYEERYKMLHDMFNEFSFSD